MAKDKKIPRRPRSPRSPREVPEEFGRTPPDPAAGAPQEGESRIGVSEMEPGPRGTLPVETSRTGVPDLERIHPEPGEGRERVPFAPNPEDAQVLTPRTANGVVRAGKLDLLLREVRTLEEAGKLFLLGEECLARWLVEGRLLLHRCLTAFEAEDREELGRNLERLQSLQAWIQEAQEDNLDLARAFTRGMARQDVIALVRDAASTFHPCYEEIRLHLPPLGEQRRTTGHALGMYQAFHLALEALAFRLGGRGTIRIEVEEGNLFLMVRFLGECPEESSLGAPPVDLLRKIRRLVVTLHRGKVFPGEDGPSGASIVLAFPLRRPELRDLDRH